MSHSPLDKIQALDAIEKEIITCMQSAGKITKIYIQIVICASHNNNANCVCVFYSLRSIVVGDGKGENESKSG